MKEISLKYICCISCTSQLEVDVIKERNEIEEGFLHCKNCGSIYPIIDKIPILWNGFENYLSQRRQLGGKLANLVSDKMKKFVKKSLTQNNPKLEDRTLLEERWTKIYQNSRGTRFYSIIKKELEKLPHANLALEYGCSIGIMSSFMAESNDFVFGVDRSFNAISIAKKKPKENLEFIVADSLSPLFGKTKFDLIVALNLLEIIEPSDFLKQISTQIDNGHLVISDPYDFERGKNTVKTPLSEHDLRKYLVDLGFKTIHNTEKPSFIPWTLKLNPRATLNYKTDLVIAKK